MHVYFSGIGGAGLAPLALIAHQAGFDVSGSDKQNSDYLTYLKKQDITDIHIGQDSTAISNIHAKNPIDWLVYSSAVPKENPHHPELVFAKEAGVKSSKRDEFLAHLLKQTGQKMIAIAGTHGKTTTTAMFVWLCEQLDIPTSYCVPAKMTFADIGHFNKEAEFFIYEADEYDRNFLSFHPKLSLISGIDYDHPDIYPTRESYYEAFLEFIAQSEDTVVWEKDAHKIGVEKNDHTKILPTLFDLGNLHLTGRVNRQNAFMVVEAACKLGLTTRQEAFPVMNKFPGLSRRFERIANNVYSDYAHTPEKIRGALQTAREIAGDNVVVIYEGLHNTRQHFIKDELPTLFKGVKKLYVAPSYLAREDETLEILTPDKLCQLTQEPADAKPVELNDKLVGTITKHADNDDLVLCLTAGGGGSLDEWLRTKFGQ